MSESLISHDSKSVNDYDDDDEKGPAGGEKVARDGFLKEASSAQVWQRQSG